MPLCIAAVATYLVLPLVASASQSQRAAELLESGIYAEEAQGDLAVAIDLYSRIAATSDAERPVVAQALLRLGMCYLKNGRADDAESVFDRLAGQYPDQRSIVAQIPSIASQLRLLSEPRDEEEKGERAVRISKFLTLVLRHNPAAAGITLDPGGWVSVDALLSGAVHHGLIIGRDEFHELVRTSPKHRFVLSDDGKYVRASYGHSVLVNLRLEPGRLP